MRTSPVRPVLRILFALVLAVQGASLAACAGAPEATVPPGVAAADVQAPTGGVNAPRWIDAPYVVLVSADGFAANYVPRLLPPAILAMAAEGIHAPGGVIPSFPTKTFPNHYSLATGAYPARHGIVANSFYDPVRDDTYRIGDREKVEDGSWYAGEPLWVTAEKQGMVAASFFWVGSEADVQGVRPSHWRRYDGEVPNDARVDQVLEWLTWPAEYRPHLITLYFSATDDAGHQFGPDSPEVEAAVAEVDRLVARLREGIASLDHADRVTLIVTSDHGMDGYGPDNIEYLDEALPSLEGIRVAESGPSGNLFVEGGEAAALQVRDAINEGLEHVTAYLAGETPARLHYRDNPRIGDVVLVADSGWVVFPSNDRPARGGFTHGWDNALSTMRALFVAAGRGLPAGVTIDPFENIDVYPLVTRLLGLEPAPGIDGDPSHWDAVLGGG